MLISHYVGEIKEKRRRKIILQVSKTRDAYHWWLRFRISRDWNNFETCYKLDAFQSWDLLYGKYPKEFEFETESFDFYFDWELLIHTEEFSRLSQDLAKLNAEFNIRKFKQLYEKYRLEEMLMNDL